jgi:hypothetical protein
VIGNTIPKRAASRAGREQNFYRRSAGKENETATGSGQNTKPQSAGTFDNKKIDDDSATQSASATKRSNTVSIPQQVAPPTTTQRWP